VACWQCTGSNNQCTSETDQGSLEYCWPNITTCSIVKLTQRTDSSVIWGVSCGVPDKEEEASSCVTVTTDTSDGYLCTCNSSYCNAIDSGKAMISRAELGITGSGLECHTCSGEAGLCSTADDEGTAVDCGEGVDTCLVATKTQDDGTSLTYRGCGAKDRPVEQKCSETDGFWLCTCTETKCNNATYTKTLMEYATSTTTTTTTTSTTTTTTTVTTTSTTTTPCDDTVTTCPTTTTTTAVPSSGVGAGTTTLAVAGVTLVSTLTTATTTLLMMSTSTVAAGAFSWISEVTPALATYLYFNLIKSYLL